MSLDYLLLRSLTARRLVAGLQGDGFTLVRQKGSHRRYVHPDGRAVTVSFHRPSDAFTIKTLHSMLEAQARWTRADLIRLELI